MIKNLLRRYGYVRLNEEDLEVLSDYYGKLILYTHPFNRDAYLHAKYLGIDCLKAVTKACEQSKNKLKI